ncbi:hypothetical protein CBM2587_A20264 [Cupriavidus taiwanensis]|uniref:Uncharacterized protein n=1 Tax=Cupriavidus taiwanensis TaxID=164546 RepID=A0A976A0S1_9BURK|nr:hypothetical protein CBM2587_A20264 [Cupriavidus taiwanensis]
MLSVGKLLRSSASRASRSCGGACGDGVRLSGGMGIPDSVFVTIVAQVRPSACRAGVGAGGVNVARGPKLYARDAAGLRDCLFATTPTRRHRNFLTRLTDRHLHSAP